MAERLYDHSNNDLIIAMIARDLERAGSRRVNEELATLLTAAAVPGGTRDKVTNGWAWDAATVHKRRVRLKRKPFAALGPYRHLFKNVNTRKTRPKVPCTVHTGSGKRKREPKTFGQMIAASDDPVPPFQSPAIREGSGNSFRGEFAAPPGQDRKTAETFMKT